MAEAWHGTGFRTAWGGDRHSRSIGYGCLALLLAFGFMIVRSVLFRSGDLLVPLSVAEVAVLAALGLNHTGKWDWAVRLAAVGILIAVVLMMVEARDGFRSIMMLCFPGLLMVAVMVLRGRDYFAVALATIATVIGLGVAEIHGLVPRVPLGRTETTYFTVFVVALILTIIAFLGGLLARDTRLNLAEIRSTVEQLAAANRELGRSEAKYRSFIQLAGDAIFVVNRDGLVLEVNQQASALTGIAAVELLGLAINRILLPSGTDSDLPQWGLPTGSAPVVRPCRVVRRDGTVVEAEVSSALLPEGVILYFCRDVTERKQVEEEREKLQAQLMHSQRMESIGRLAGGVAHDFNNLLTVIIGYSELALGRLREEDAMRFHIAAIAKAGERAADLTQQLLAVSRKQIIQPRPVDLNAEVRETREMLQRLVGEDVEVIVAPGSSTGMVIADPGQVHQVLMNLAANARDAMPHGGKLVLETRDVVLDGSRSAGELEVPRGSYVLLTVSDTGVGMDEDTRQRIFEPFFTTKADATGTGLGLSTVYGIVRQNRGRISVYSEPGNGTAFKIYLPSAEGASGALEVAALPNQAAPRGSETILVVEDQGDVRQLARDVLIECGYSVLEAASGEEALRLAGSAATPIDLVITDVVMPGMTGRELGMKLGALNPKMKVLYMSGYPESVVAHRGVLEPGLEFTPKPFTPLTLATKVRQVLGKDETAPGD